MSLPCPSTHCHETMTKSPRNGLNIDRLEASLPGPEGKFRLLVEGLSLAPGEMVALTGESGAGKTLLLEMMGLMRATASGSIYTWTDAHGHLCDLAALWSRGIRSAALAKMRGRLFGFVPQTGGLLPYLNVRQNVTLPQLLTDKRDEEHVARLLGALDLTPQAAMFPGQLSVGQRQRVAIARALSHRPAFVVADEPTASLDPVKSDRVLHLLLAMAQETDCGVILSSHEVDRIRKFRLPRLHLNVKADGAGGVVSELSTEVIA